MSGCEIGVVFVNHESQDTVAPRARMLRANGFAVVVVDKGGMSVVNGRVAFLPRPMPGRD